MYYIYFLIVTLLFNISFCEGTTVIWKGEINSNGTPTEAVKLIPGERYQIIISGTMNLGKWWKNGEPLEEDACFEFNKNVKPSHIESVRNSLNISVCTEGKFQPNHIYRSLPFRAAQSAVHFWVYDIDYNDNKGALQAQVIHLEDQDEG